MRKRQSEKGIAVGGQVNWASRTPWAEDDGSQYDVKIWMTAEATVNDSGCRELHESVESIILHE